MLFGKIEGMYSTWRLSISYFFYGYKLFGKIDGIFKSATHRFFIKYFRFP